MDVVENVERIQNSECPSAVRIRGCGGEFEEDEASLLCIKLNFAISSGRMYPIASIPRLSSAYSMPEFNLCKILTLVRKLYILGTEGQ